MRKFLINYIELAGMVLQFPEDLGLYTDKIPDRKRNFIVTLLISSVSVSTGFYLLRASYASDYLIHIGLVTLVQMLFLPVMALFVSSLFDALLAPLYPGQSGRTAGSFAIIILSTLPFLFFYPLAVIAKIAPMSSLFSILSFLLLLFWSGSIQVRAFRYLYELSTKKIVRIYLKTIGLILVFPILFVVFMSVEMGGLFI